MKKNGDITLRDIYLEIKDVSKKLDGHNKRIVKLEKKSNLLNWSACIVCFAVFVNVFFTTEGGLQARWNKAWEVSQKTVVEGKK